MRREQERRGDPRWALLPAPEENPAITFYLATGRHAVGRVRGCWTTINVGYEGLHGADEDQLLGVYWYHHGAAITADATAHDFEPWMLTKRRPHGRGFAAWRKSFIEKHTY